MLGDIQDDAGESLAEALGGQAMRFSATATLRWRPRLRD